MGLQDAQQFPGNTAQRLMQTFTDQSVMQNAASRQLMASQAQPMLNNQVQPMLDNQAQPLMNNQAQPLMNNQAQPLMNNQAQPLMNNQAQPLMNYQEQPEMNNQAQSMVSNAPQPMMNSQIQMNSQALPAQQLANFFDTQANVAQGRSFLGMASQSETAAVVSKLSDAIEAQSKALTVLEAQQVQLANREAAFEADALRMMRAGKCSDYSKNNVGPIKDSASCKSGCETGEGISGCNRFSGTAGDTAKCSCSRRKTSGSCNSWTTICNDLSAGLTGSIWVVLCTFAVLLREFD
jgi:hypothetical protein